MTTADEHHEREMWLSDMWSHDDTITEAQCRDREEAAAREGMNE